MMNCYLCKALPFIVILLLPAPAFSVSLDELLAGVDAHVDSLQDLVGTAQFETEIRGHRFAGQIDFQYVDDYWLLKMRGLYDTPLEDGFPHRDEIILYTDNHVITYYHTMSQVLIDHRSRRNNADSLVLAGMGTIEASGRPLRALLAYAHENPELVNWTISEEEGLATIRLEYSEAPGQPPYSVRAVTIATGRQHAVVEHVLIQDGRPVIEGYVEMQTDAATGIEVPRSADFIHSRPVTGEVELLQSITFEQLRVNTGLRPQDLDVLVPAGTMVSHKVLGTAYYAAVPLTADELIAGEGMPAPTPVQREGPTSPALDRARGIGPMGLIYGVGGALIILGGLAWFLRGRRRNA